MHIGSIREDGPKIEYGIGPQGDLEWGEGVQIKLGS